MNANQNPHKTHGDILTEISEGMVRIMKKNYGSGPSQTKTTYGDDLVLVVMRGEFTKVERTLSEHGQGHMVAQFRHAFQEAMKSDFCSIVEQATGRKVIGFMSGNQDEPDMLGEIFVLEPAPG